MGFFQLGRDLRWLFVSSFLWMFGSGLYYYTFPVYVAQQGATPAQVGLLYALGFLASTICILPSGWMSQRFERRGILIAAWAIAVLSGPIMYLAHDWRWLVVAEVLNMGTTFTITTVQAYALQADTSGRPAYTLSVVFSAFPLGMVLSPWLGGLMAAQWGPRSVFLGTTVVYVLSTLALLPMSRQWSTRRGPAGAARPPWRAELLRALLGWSKIRPALWRIGLMVGWGELVLAATLALGQVYLVEAGGAGYGGIGIYGSLASAGGALIGPMLARLAETASHRRALQVAAVLLIGYGGILLAAPRLMPAVAAAFVFRGATEGTRGLRAATVAHHAGDADIEHVLSFANLAGGIYATVGSYLGGWLYQWRQGAPFWLVVAGGLIYVVVLQVGLPRQAVPDEKRAGG